MYNPGLYVIERRKTNMKKKKNETIYDRLTEKEKKIIDELIKKRGKNETAKKTNKRND
jgi:FixJ family two-component response regulator